MLLRTWPPARRTRRERLQRPMHPLVTRIVLWATGTGTAHLDALTHPLHRHAAQPTDLPTGERRTVVAVDPQRNAVPLEGTPRAPQLALDARRSVAVHAHHEPRRVVQDRHRVAQRSVAETELPLEIHCALVVRVIARTVRTGWATQIRVATTTTANRHLTRSAKRVAHRDRRQKRRARIRPPQFAPGAYEVPRPSDDEARSGEPRSTGEPAATASVSQGGGPPARANRPPSIETATCTPSSERSPRCERRPKPAAPPETPARSSDVVPTR